MKAIEIPQADRLERVRDVLEALDRGHATTKAIAQATGLSPRHVHYNLGAARILGWLDRQERSPVLTVAGKALLSTPHASSDERQVIADSIRESPSLTGFVADLLHSPAPTRQALAEKIQERTGLSGTTALRRAQTLLQWRAYVTTRELFDRAGVTRILTAREREASLASEPRVASLRTSLTSLTLRDFKNFEAADLELGTLTVVVGANATGKSNLRDAFRFLHGVSRGYTLAEVLGEKWVEGGVLQWKGLRGGTREATFQGRSCFTLQVGFNVVEEGRVNRGTYRIEVDLSHRDRIPRVSAERLHIEGRGKYVFDSHPDGPDGVAHQSDPRQILVTLRKNKGFIGKTIALSNDRPVLSQILEHPDARNPSVREHARWAIAAFQSMRFLDLSPDSMRRPSLPGQKILGDKGENLSSVIQAICTNSSRKRVLITWIRELTPVDVIDFDFVPDPSGKVLLFLIEQNGQKTSANSASDGTLRFLAMIAALVAPEAARFYFFEELENGIHPTRLHLLLQLIEQQTEKGEIQVVATSHSPHLLAELSAEARANAVLTYRLPGRAAASVKRITEIPAAQKILDEHDISKLHATGWFENAALFGEGEEA